MTRALHAAALAGLIVWWAPTLAAGFGIQYRLRRVRRLIARGDFDEAERVVDAIVRDEAAAVRWRGAVQP